MDVNPWSECARESEKIQCSVRWWGLPGWVDAVLRLLGMASAFNNIHQQTGQWDYL